MTDLNFNDLTDSQKRLFAVRCALRVQHLMQDPRSIVALGVAERYAKGQATIVELDAARAAAGDAVCAVSAAAWAALAARATASGLARIAASDAAWAAENAASAAEREAQAKILDEIKQEIM